MKIKILLCALLALMSIQVFAANTQAAIVVSKNDPVAKVVLPANPTTGYQWYIAQYPDELVDHVSQTYEAARTKSVGAGGQSIWSVKLDDDAFTAPHLIKLTFEYVRPWDLSQSSEQVAYLVTK